MELKDATKKIELKTSQPVTATSVIMQELLQNVETFPHPMTFLQYQVNEGRYTYDATCDGGRIWRNTIHPHDGNTISFDVPDGWTSAEIKHHADCRNLCYRLVDKYGLHDLEVRWLTQANSDV